MMRGRWLVVVSMLSAAVSCVESQSVHEAAPSVTAASTPAASVDSRAFFDKAVRAMEKMGRVEQSDFEHGIITGITHTGVAMEIEVVQREGRTPELNVQAELPAGMAGLGTISEPDRYMAIFRDLGSRR